LLEQAGLLRDPVPMRPPPLRPIVGVGREHAQAQADDDGENRPCSHPAPRLKDFAARVGPLRASPGRVCPGIRLVCILKSLARAGIGNRPVPGGHYWIDERSRRGYSCPVVKGVRSYACCTTSRPDGATGACRTARCWSASSQTGTRLPSPPWWSATAA